LFYVNVSGIYEVFVGHKNFHFGKQPDLLPGTQTVCIVLSYLKYKISSGLLSNQGVVFITINR